MLFLLIFYLLFPQLPGELLGELRHRSILCANIGTYFNSKFMCLFDRFSCQNCRAESARKTVSGAHSISNFNRWSLLERLCCRCEDIASINATGENKHL